MHDLVRKFAVVCENEHTLGVLVQPSDGINPLAYVRDKLRNALSAFFVAHRSDKAARLIEHYVAVLGARHNNSLAADKDLVLVRHLVAKDRGLAVDLDLALQNQLLSLSARRDAALSQKFL